MFDFSLSYVSQMSGTHGPPVLLLTPFVRHSSRLVVLVGEANITSLYIFQQVRSFPPSQATNTCNKILVFLSGVSWIFE